MTGLFRKKKTKEDIDAEYADALAEFRKLINPQPVTGLLNESEDELPADIEDSTSLTPLIKNTVQYTQQELPSLLQKIKDLVKDKPAEIPLMTRALISLTNALNKPSPENLKELIWTALAVSRKGDAFLGVSTSMAGVGLSLFITSLVVGATVAAAATAFPIMIGVAIGLMLTGAIVFLTGVDHVLLSKNSAIAKEIKNIKTTLSRL